MDHDDHGLILPAPQRRKIIKTMSSSGMPITDCLLEGFEIEATISDGSYEQTVGENYELCAAAQCISNPISSLAGGYHVNFCLTGSSIGTPTLISDFGQRSTIPPATWDRRSPTFLPGSTDWPLG
jgi:hypothetical protein